MYFNNRLSLEHLLDYISQAYFFYYYEALIKWFWF